MFVKQNDEIYLSTWLKKILLMKLCHLVNYALNFCY